MTLKKYLLFLTCLLMMFITVACERVNTVCTPEIGTPKPTFQLDELILITPEPKTYTTTLPLEIGGKTIVFDKLVDYPICNDTWAGTVYVNCEAQVAEANLEESDNPLFFKGCDLTIEPNSVIYVAAHNNAPYYKGCSCHTGEEPTK